MGNGGRRQCQCHAVNSTHRSGHLALDALRVTPHSMRGPVYVSPRTTMRGPEREGKGQVPQTIFLDTASQRGMTRWSPRTTMRGPERKGKGQVPQTVFLDTASQRGMTWWSPRTRCGVQRGASCGYCLCRYSLPGYFWIPHQVRNDGKYRVTVRYDVEHRIKCGMTEKKRNI